MLKKFSSLFASSRPTFLQQIQKLTLLTDSTEINNYEVTFLIEQFHGTKEDNVSYQIYIFNIQTVKQAKVNIQTFIEYINQNDLICKTPTIQLKILLLFHQLLQNILIGKRVAKQITKQKINFLKISQQDCFHQTILIPYFSYLFRFAVNWEQTRTYGHPHIYYTYTNLTNLAFTIVPHLKEYKENIKLFTLIKLLSLTLYLELEKFYKHLIKRLQNQAKELSILGERVIELNECFNEINELSQKMVTFYSYIIQYSEAKKILPPISVSLSGPVVAEMKRLVAIETQKKKKKQMLQIDTAAIQKQEPIMYHQPDVSAAKMIIHSAKAATGTIKRLNLENIERPDKEIHTHRHEKRTIDFELYRNGPQTIKIQQQQVPQVTEEIEEEPEPDERFMKNDDKNDK